jgi:hypothetical protein
MHTTRTTRARLVIRSLVVATALGVVPVAAASSTAQAAPYCGITWGSLAKSRATLVQGPVTNVRSGRHACFDRLVIDLRGRAPGWTVRYVSTFTGQASGLPIALRGGARLAVTVNAPATKSSGAASYTPRNRTNVVNVTGYRTFRQVRWDSSFEGYTSLGIGVRARLPFRVFTIQDATGSRLVVDVAHRW